MRYKDNVILPQGSEVQENIEAGGNVYVGKSAKIEGSIEAGGKINIGPSSKVVGKITANEGIYISSKCKLGHVECDKNITFGEGTTVDIVISRGDVLIGKDCHIGDLFVTGKVIYS